MTENAMTPNRRRIAGEGPRRTTNEGPDGGATPTPATPAMPEQPPPDNDGHAPAHASTLGNVPTWLLVGLAILATMALAFDLISMIGATNDAARAETQSASVTSAYNTAPAQAERAAEQVFGFDYATMQQDTDDAKATMTAAYAETFQKTVDDLVASPVAGASLHVEAKVMASGVVSATANDVEVLLFVDQVSSTKAKPAPQTALNRVILSMVKTGDRWLVNDVTAL